MYAPDAIRIAFLVALVMRLSHPCAVQGQTSSSGARDAALGGSSIASLADPWSEANPAGWSQLGFGAAVHVAQLYGLNELRLGAARVGFGLRGTSLVAGARSFGYEDYRATDFTLGIARALRWGTHRPFHLGFRLRSHGISIRGYGSAAAYALSAGIILPIAPGTDLGLSAENFLTFSEKIGDELRRTLHAGVSIRAGSLTMLAGASKDATAPVTARFGIEAHLVEAVSLRAGYAVVPPRFASGIGIRLLPLTVDLAAERHFVLGWSPSCSVGLRW